MNAFINGAICALTRCLNLIANLDPEGNNLELQEMKTQILIYIKMYKNIAVLREEKGVKDETWEKITEADDLSKEQLEVLEEIVAKA